MIANTGDDVEIYGVHVSPDPDLVTYWLAGIIDERGWGIGATRGRRWRRSSATARGSGSATATSSCAGCAPTAARGPPLTEAHAAVVDALGVRRPCCR